MRLFSVNVPLSAIFSHCFLSFAFLSLLVHQQSADKDRLEPAIGNGQSPMLSRDSVQQPVIGLVHPGPKINSLTLSDIRHAARLERFTNSLIHTGLHSQSGHKSYIFIFVGVSATVGSFGVLFKGLFSLFLSVKQHVCLHEL